MATNPNAKKVAKKTAKKVSKKVSKKVTKKVAKKATVTKKRPVAKKAAKKVTKKVTKKTSAAKKKTAKKATKKSTKKATPKTSTAGIDQLQDLLKSNLSGMSSEKAEALAKNIWLAGLGAYARTRNELEGRIDDLQDRYESINAEGQKVFEELVDRGVSMQGEFEKVVEQGKETLEDRVEELRKRFGGGLSSFVDIPGRLRDAAEKIEELSDKLQKKK